MQHGDVFNQVLKLIKVLSQLSRKSDDEGLFPKSMDIRRNFTKPAHKGEARICGGIGWGSRHNEKIIGCKRLDTK